MQIIECARVRGIQIMPEVEMPEVEMPEVKTQSILPSAS